MAYEGNLGRVVGSRIYSGVAYDDISIKADLSNQGITRLLDGDIYISIAGTYSIFKYEAGFFTKTADIWNESRVSSLEDEVDGLRSMAEEYIPARSYLPGEVVIYDDRFYLCTAATSGSWDSTKWQALTLDYLLGLTKVDDHLDSTSLRAVQNAVITAALDLKLDKSATITNQDIDDMFPIS